MIRDITELKGIYGGEIVWLIAAGPSMDYIEPSFFSNKITMGINQVHRKYKCDYLTVLEPQYFLDVYDAALRQGAALIASKHGWVDRDRHELIFPTEGREEQDFWAYDITQEFDPNDNKILTGFSTLHVALHICAYMGFHTIMMCGADGGELDGKKYFEGYRENNIIGFDKWITTVQDHTIKLRKILADAYGCHIVSLNPFVNFGLEGHRFSR